MPGPRLELTWPNKEQFLLTPKDDDGKPVWVPRSHPAAHEVRLTRPVGAVGATNDADPYTDSTVFVGDSLDAMRVLCEVPEWAAHYRGKVKLIYADPPFNTGQTFTHYDDWMEHSTWLSFMRDRLLLIKDLLAPDGTLWLHLDNYESHRMRCLLDEVFGADNYLNTVVWKRTSAKSAAKRGMGTMYDNLLIYGKNPAAKLAPILLPYSAEYLRTKYSNEDERGRYRLDNLTAAGIRRGDSGEPWRDYDPAARGNHWRAPSADELLGPAAEEMTTREKLEALLASGFIQLPKKAGGAPQFKRYLNPDGGVALGDFWADINVINSQGKERTGYDTQKPEALIARVITMASKPGDIVLDPFAGSGTTAAVAHKMGRRWLTCEVLPATVDGHIIARLTKVIAGEDPAGVTDRTAWAGGGGFRVVEVEPSLYEAGPGGMVLMRDNIGADDLARAMCGQLRFTHTPGDPTFAGRRGRMMLAVVPGVVGAEQVDDLLDALPEGTRLTVAAGAFVPGVADHLADASRGSRALKIPRDVLARSLRRASDRQEADR